MSVSVVTRHPQLTTNCAAFMDWHAALAPDCHSLLGCDLGLPPFSAPDCSDHIVNHYNAVQLLIKLGGKISLKLLDNFPSARDVRRIEGQAGTVHHLHGETARILHIPRPTETSRRGLAKNPTSKPGDRERACYGYSEMRVTSLPYSL
jgi:hypothetical protein